MSTPRKHHYLPQFYLQGFSSNGRSLTQIDKNSRKTVTCALKDIASIRDYHRIDSDDVDDPHQLERQLSTIEAELSVALKEILQSGIHNHKSHARLIELVLMLRMRIPAMKSMIEESLRQVVRSSGIIMERAGALPTPPPGLEDACSMSKLQINISNWICLKYMFKLAADQDIFKLLASMRPSLLRAPPSTAFVTCDQPVAVYSPSAYIRENSGVALGAPDVEITLALSSNITLMLDWKKSGGKERILNDKEVEELNRRTVIMATSYVFAPTPYQKTANKLVGQYGKYSAGMQPPKTMDTGNSTYHILHSRPVVSPDKY